jgi:hypothetical protein
MLARLLKQTNLVNRLRGAWRHDADEAMKPIRKELRRLSREVEQLQATLQETAIRAARGDKSATQLRLVAELNAQQHDRISALPSLLNEAEIAAHIRRAIAEAPLRPEPFPHIVIDGLLPQRIYDLLLEAMPPLAFFTDHDPIKQDLHLPITLAPVFAMSVWNFMDGVIARQMIQPAALAKFHEPLQRHFDNIFGPEFRDQANALPELSSGGRLMMRRPGYYLAAHRDPKRSLMTCLMYLARPGDDEAHGTQLFRVKEDREAPFKQTYYPEPGQCELVEVVPFRPNSMLVFLNSHGAHGATIPADAKDVERYTYQFYVAPDNAALGALIRELPTERRVTWQNRNKYDG